MHPDKYEKMPMFANRYPKMKLIIAHLGSIEHIDAIQRAENGNIYTDTSGGASVNNHVIEYAVSKVGSEKILFGTDMPWSGQKEYIEIIRHLNLTEEEKANYPLKCPHCLGVPDGTRYCPYCGGKLV